jgi:hypothetical protein
VSDWHEVEKIVLREHKRWMANRDAEADLLSLRYRDYRETP